MKKLSSKTDWCMENDWTKIGLYKYTYHIRMYVAQGNRHQTSMLIVSFSSHYNRFFLK